MLINNWLIVFCSVLQLIGGVVYVVSGAYRFGILFILYGIAGVLMSIGKAL